MNGNGFPGNKHSLLLRPEKFSAVASRPARLPLRLSLQAWSAVFHLPRFCSSVTARLPSLSSISLFHLVFRLLRVYSSANAHPPPRPCPFERDCPSPTVSVRARLLISNYLSEPERLSSTPTVSTRVRCSSLTQSCLLEAERSQWSRLPDRFLSPTVPV